MKIPTKRSGMFHRSNMIFTTLSFIFLSMCSIAQAQTVTQSPPSDGPLAYPGMPNTTYGPDWQDCTYPYYSYIPHSLPPNCSPCRSHACPGRRPIFRTGLTESIDYRVASLPYAPALPNSTFAGSVSVNRENHPNNTLFFVAFEKEAGSLTAAANERSDEPWVIWLNGGYVFILLVLIKMLMLIIFCLM